MWENKRIQVNGNLNSLDRVYKDGKHSQYDGSNFANSGGAVSINFLSCGSKECQSGKGVQVHYCLPIVFPGAKVLFEQSLKNYPCKGTALGRSYQGIAISRKALLGREPL